jgi:hypothetical protein
MLGVSYEGCLNKREVRVVIALLKNRAKERRLTKTESRILRKLKADFKEMDYVLK